MTIINRGFIDDELIMRFYSELENENDHKIKDKKVEQEIEEMKRQLDELKNKIK